MTPRAHLIGCDGLRNRAQNNVRHRQDAAVAVPACSGGGQCSGSVKVEGSDAGELKLTLPPIVLALV